MRDKQPANVTLNLLWVVLNGLLVELTTYIHKSLRRLYVAGVWLDMHKQTTGSLGDFSS